MLNSIYLRYCGLQDESISNRLLSFETLGGYVAILSSDYLDSTLRVDTEEELAVIGHYEQAEVAGKIYSIGECVLVFVSIFVWSFWCFAKLRQW